MSDREYAIDFIVEILREAGTKADQLAKQRRAVAAKSDSEVLATANIIAAAKNDEIAFRCEQLCEAITGALLFDQLDADDKASAAPTPPTVSDMRAIFGEPVEGRDYDVMPGGES